MISRLSRKLERRDTHSDKEKQAFEGAVARVKEARMDEDMVRGASAPARALFRSKASPPTISCCGMAPPMIVLGRGQFLASRPSRWR